MNFGWISVGLASDMPVLIAGPTASGKSALAMDIASRAGGVIINADALQVFANWNVLTARPGERELAVASHALYGHVPGDHTYSVGQWLSAVAPLIAHGPRPIIVGGTGLYFSALTEGLADIPATPRDVRQTAMRRIEAGEIDQIEAELDGETRSRIDLQNPMRVQRAWEVLQTTGRGLAAWQDQTPEPLLPLKNSHAILLMAERDELNVRIGHRFDAMIENGALDEARANLAGWSPSLPSAKAIGAPELIAYLSGELALSEAVEKAKLATRQYAKRQRSWFRSRMGDWRVVSVTD